MAQKGFADHQRKAMLGAIHEREGRWDQVDPDTEVGSIGEGIGLSEDQSYELFGQLVDEGLVDPGRAYRAGRAMPDSTSRIVGREDNMTVIGDDVGLLPQGVPRSSDYGGAARGSAGRPEHSSVASRLASPGPWRTGRGIRPAQPRGLSAYDDPRGPRVGKGRVLA